MENLQDMHGHTLVTEETLEMAPILELITSCKLTTDLASLLHTCVMFQRRNYRETRFIDIAHSICQRSPSFNFST